MLIRYRIVAAAALALATCGAAQAEVSVTYVKPDQFSDVPYGVRERETVMKELTAHFNELGRQLPAGQTLKVEVLDVDLAGWVYPRRWGPDNIRVLRGGADWPHMHLRFTLEENGKVVRSGDSQLANMSYQMRMNRYASDDPLRYEKQMMDDWFKQEFGPANKAG